jgi:hypothetical protein
VCDKEREREKPLRARAVFPIQKKKAPKHETFTHPPPPADSPLPSLSLLSPLSLSHRRKDSLSPSALFVRCTAVDREWEGRGRDGALFPPLASLKTARFF